QAGGSGGFGGNVQVTATNGSPYICCGGGTVGGAIGTSGAVQSGRVDLRSFGNMTLAGEINTSSQGTASGSGGSGNSINISITQGNLYLAQGNANDLGC